MHIDWSTLALQTVNVLVLIWLLARFLFRPARSITDERRAAAEKLLADDPSARDQTNNAADQVQARLHDSAVIAERTLAASQLQAENERAKLLTEAANSAIQLREAAKTGIEVDRAAMERTLRQKACDLAVVIARRLLLRLPAPRSGFRRSSGNRDCRAAGPATTDRMPIHDGRAVW
jgi:F-type H+-transporting ATPase subunit b